MARSRQTGIGPRVGAAHPSLTITDFTRDHAASSGAPGPHQNRVVPDGSIIRASFRGELTGNRGILHRGERIIRPYRGKLWITCALKFKDYRLPQWAAHHFTVLFFYDEAVSLAAGHRPCALCRRPAYEDYRRAWMLATGRREKPYSHELDAVLHDDRLMKGTFQRKLITAPIDEVPAGAFILDGRRLLLVEPSSLREWTFEGYGRVEPKKSKRRVRVLTPKASLQALRGGYTPQVRQPG